DQPRPSPFPRLMDGLRRPQGRAAFAVHFSRAVRTRWLLGYPGRVTGALISCGARLHRGARSKARARPSGEGGSQAFHAASARIASHFTACRFPRCEPYETRLDRPAMKRPSFCARSGDAGALARRQLLQGLLAVAATFGAAACRSPTTKHLRGEKVDAGCAMCLFGMQGVRACIWAVSIDGKPYLA